MSDKDKQLNKGELIDIKSLIGDADGGDYSLDDILAEFGHPAAPPSKEDSSEERFNTIDLSQLPRPSSRPQSGPTGGKVVAFPGTAGRPKGPAAEDPPPEEAAADEEPEETPSPPEEEVPVIPFPKEESVQQRRWTGCQILPAERSACNGQSSCDLPPFFLFIQDDTPSEAKCKEEN